MAFPLLEMFFLLSTWKINTCSSFKIKANVNPSVMFSQTLLLILIKVQYILSVEHYVECSSKLSHFIHKSLLQVCEVHTIKVPILRQRKQVLHELNNLPKVTELVSGRQSFKSKSVWLYKQGFPHLFIQTVPMNFIHALVTSFSQLNFTYFLPF